jgi:hypothetical protein
MMNKIRLELARTHKHPDGAHDVGYEFAAPLDDNGRISSSAWHKDKQHCRVRRFRPGEEDDIGHLIRKPGGSWAFHYDIHSDEEDDESGYRFGDHVFKPGEYVSIREDEELVTYRVVQVLGMAAQQRES